MSLVFAAAIAHALSPRWSGSIRDLIDILEMILLYYKDRFPYILFALLSSP
jgi:hypothetical protein